MSQSYFEQEFRKMVEAVVEDVVRRELHQHLEALQEPWVSIDRAAELLQVSPRTVKRHIACGMLTTSQPMGARRPLVERASIAKLLETARVGARHRLMPFEKVPGFTGSHPLNDPEQVRRGKLGYERRRLQKQGLAPEAVEMALWRAGLRDKP